MTSLGTFLAYGLFVIAGLRLLIGGFLRFIPTGDMNALATTIAGVALICIGVAISA